MVGNRKSRSRGTIVRNEDGRNTFRLCATVYFKVSGSLPITICGSRTGHGWLPSAVCSSATEFFVHRPCTHGTALLLSDVHGLVTSRFEQAYAVVVVSCMAAICLEYPSPIFSSRFFLWATVYFRIVFVAPRHHGSWVILSLQHSCYWPAFTQTILLFWFLQLHRTAVHFEGACHNTLARSFIS